MKVLVDSCAGLWPVDPGDEEILHRALAAGQIVVTRDKDFGTLHVLQQLSHGGILRLVELPPETEANVCAGALVRYETELLTGALVTVQERRTRIRGR